MEAIFVGQFLDLDVLGNRFAPNLELSDLVSAFFNGLLELTLFALIGFGLLGLHFLGNWIFLRIGAIHG